MSFEPIHYSATLKSKKGKHRYKKLCQVVDKIGVLPEKSMRLYHPSYFGGFNNVKEDALTFILDKLCQ